MPISEGSWHLTKVDANRTKVTHEFKGDPAGNIPASMVNLFLVAGPIHTLTSLNAYVKGK
jgi:hypothetical protein